MEAHKKNDQQASSSREERSENARDRVENANDPKEREEHKPAATLKQARARKTKNNVRKLRMERMMSKAELARRAVVSSLTIDRVERGMPCRMDTKRKILEALGLKPSDRVMVFGDSPDELDEVDD